LKRFNKKIAFKTFVLLPVGRKSRPPNNIWCRDGTRSTRQSRATSNSRSTWTATCRSDQIPNPTKKRWPRLKKLKDSFWNDT
jgi:hypothetical protein